MEHHTQYHHSFILTQVGGVERWAIGLGGGAGREAVGGRAGETVTGWERAIQGGKAAAGVEQVGLLGDFPEEWAALSTDKQNTKYQ